MTSGFPVRTGLPEPPTRAPLAAESLLIQAILAGNRKAIADFVQRYSDCVYGFLHQRMTDLEDLDDLTQEVFVAAWQGLEQFQGVSRLETWLCGIASHKVANYYRQRIHDFSEETGNSGDGLTEAPMPIDLDAEASLDQGRLTEKIRAVLNQLPEPYRLVLLWRYWDERPIADMAALSGKTVKAIERLLARARHAFAKRWSHE